MGNIVTICWPSTCPACYGHAASCTLCRGEGVVTRAQAEAEDRAAFMLRVKAAGQDGAA